MPPLTEPSKPGAAEVHELSDMTLIRLINLTFQVFMPALSFNQHKDAATGFASEKISDSPEYEAGLPSVPGETYHSMQLIRDEFLMNIQKFANNIQRTMQQLEGKLHVFFCFVTRGNVL